MMQNEVDKASPTLVYLVTEDWYFLSHRLPMACAAQRAGYQVHVATRSSGRASEIEAHGFQVHLLPWHRGSFNPFRVLAAVGSVRRLYRALSPDLVHHVALQPTIIGSLAAIGLPITCLNAVAGFGFAFASPTKKARMVRAVVGALLLRLLNRPRAAVLVQNPDDRAEIVALGVAPERITLIPGSGVDGERLKPLPEPEGAVTIAFVGRLLKDKGILTLIAAHAQLASRGRLIRLLIAGEPDPANPASIPDAVIASWRNRPGIEVLGNVDDISRVWAAAHIGVLPSRREGLPKSLLEAAAFGRPIIATDVPGCREIAHPGVNALLVPPDDPAALAEAIERLAGDADLRRRFGAASRSLVEANFSSAQIGREIVALYDHLLQRSGNSRPVLQELAVEDQRM